MNIIPFNQKLQQKSAASEIPESRAMIELLRMLVKGIEPPAYALRVRCSTPELHQLKAFFLSNKKYYTTSSQKRNIFLGSVNNFV